MEKGFTRKFNEKSYDIHRDEYSKKIRGQREKFKHLDSTDTEILKIMDKVLKEEKSLSIVDVACGTGDRLEIILEKLGVDRENIKSITGLDYSGGMLEIAKQKEYKGSHVYDYLEKFDATKSNTAHKGNIVLCLWSVLNNITHKRKKVFKNLSAMCTQNGYIMLDVYTTRTKKHIEAIQKELINEGGNLPDLTDKNIFYYKRDDGTIASSRLISVDEINDFVKSAGLKYYEVFGYTKENQELQLAMSDTEELPKSLEEVYDALFFVLKHK